MGFRVVADDNIEITPALAAIASELHRLPGRAIARANLGEADILLVRSVTEVTEALLAGSPVAFVGSATAGLDHVDLDYLSGKGIRFSSAPGANANAVVEYVLSVLAERDRLAQVLGGGSIGIVGYGHIGSRLASILAALGGRVHVWDPWQRVPRRYRSPSLEQVLSQPVVSLHASLHRKLPWPSYALIDAEHVAASVKGQLVINASRGGVLTAGALKAWYEAGAELVLDVWPDEPSITDRQLAEVALGTPHIAGYSLEAKENATNMLVAAVTGEPPVKAPVAAAIVDMTACASLSPSDWLRALLLQHYNPVVDYRDLCRRSVGGISPEAFEALRSGYALRRELRGLRLRVGEQCPAVLRGLCDILGLRPEDTSTL